MIGRLGLFAGCSIALWLLTSAVAFLFWPEQWQGVLASTSIAFALCMLPTAATLVWSSWGINQSPQQQLISVLGGTGIRMFFVLGVGLLVATSIPAIHEYRRIFWLWVLVYYLASLALEMFLVLRGHAAASRVQHESSSSLSQ